jgi:hypothetical protein
MTVNFVGPWIEVNPSEVVKGVTYVRDSSGNQSTPSPYDIPLAVRINEGGLQDPAFSIELRYVGGQEQTRSNVVADCEVQLGARSGRVYRVLVDTKHATHGGRQDMLLVKRAIEGLTKQAALDEVPGVNYKLACIAVEKHEQELVGQLVRFNTRALGS